MGNKYNDFLAELKAKYQRGDNSDIWEMVSSPVLVVVVCM